MRKEGKRGLPSAIEELGESSRLSNASRRLLPWPASRADFFWLSRHKKSSKKMSAFKTSLAA